MDDVVRAEDPRTSPSAATATAPAPATAPLTATPPVPAPAPAPVSVPAPATAPGREAVTAPGPAPGGNPRPGRRLHVLDGLRFLAALMVVGYHYLGYDHWWRSPWGASTASVFPVAHPAAVYGWLGVELFFLISGFVICLSCWGRTPRQFAVSRFVRLYPAYWFAVAVTSAVLLLRPGGWDGSARDILTDFTMFQEPLGARDIDGVYWSLWAELRFYLLFAVVAAVGLTYRRVVGFCVAWLLAATLAPGSGSGLFNLMVVPEYAPFFVGGIVIHLIHRFGARRPELWLLLGASWLMARDSLAGLVSDADHSVGGGLSLPVALAIVTSFYALMLAAALGGLDFMNWRLLGLAGSLTYPLYLLHEDIGWEVIRHTHGRVNAWALVCVLVALMLSAAWLVHRFVERPVASRLKSWLS
ncbi:acyltransferase [Streptomyces sp. HPF1205]|uniref:acyltransferase family protein n=1 Tax=Streptomyces sp. HPF1205 TaxID=2873262 RepID=UPI001CED2A38|nr:acyltransferase [Streptomyces sp. HPF1205]